MPPRTENQRRDPRVPTRFEALISAEREEGAGVLRDISYSGAQIAEASIKPPIGTKLRLYVFIQPVSPTELQGQVVRHDEDGFAVEFSELSPEGRHLVDDASALVSVPLGSSR